MMIFTADVLQNLATEATGPTVRAVKAQGRVPEAADKAKTSHGTIHFAGTFADHMDAASANPAQQQIPALAASPALPMALPVETVHAMPVAAVPVTTAAAGLPAGQGSRQTEPGIGSVSKENPVSARPDSTPIAARGSATRQSPASPGDVATNRPKGTAVAAQKFTPPQSSALPGDVAATNLPDGAVIAAPVTANLQPSQSPGDVAVATRPDGMAVAAQGPANLQSSTLPGDSPATMQPDGAVIAAPVTAALQPSASPGDGPVAAGTFPAEAAEPKAKMPGIAAGPMAVPGRTVTRRGKTASAPESSETGPAGAAPVADHARSSGAHPTAPVAEQNTPQAAAHVDRVAAAIQEQVPAPHAMTPAALPTERTQHEPSVQTETAAPAAHAADTQMEPSLNLRTLASTTHALEVGVGGSAHGWLRVRAELGPGGEVTTAMLAGSAESAASLRRILPGLAEFLDGAQSTPVIAMNAGVSRDQQPSSGGHAQRQLQPQGNGTEAGVPSAVSPASPMPAELSGHGGWLSVRV